jgi:hypothetical protein
MAHSNILRGIIPMVATLGVGAGFMLSKREETLTYRHEAQENLRDIHHGPQVVSCDSECH